ncbi:DUF3828 domain-containing protein [Ktedonosporobacter rubrisoli]|uniref:DUF3828 domain-containing protein n=1 Tax=Ktedonosporobacter rubrisoli TaxID=2509675 RepID=UPI0013EEC6C3|nr:DUF3828 domain-containing protein [Ktedonosporobacter rubrisoli]
MLFKQANQVLDASKGKVSSTSITSTNISTDNGTNTATFTVSVQRNGQPYNVHLELKQEGNNWKIVNLDNI